MAPPKLDFLVRKFAKTTKKHGNPPKPSNTLKTPLNPHKPLKPSKILKHS